MEKELTTIEFLENFARKTNRNIESSYKKCPQSIKNRSFHYKSHAILTSKYESNMYFVNFADTKYYGDNAMYCGCFFPIKAPKDSKILVRKKNVLDKINPNLKQSIYKGQFNGFEKQMVFEENDDYLLSKIFNNSKVQKAIVDTLKLDERLRVGINHIGIDVVPELNEKSHFGIFLTDVWLQDEAILEHIYKVSEELSLSIGQTNIING